MKNIDARETQEMMESDDDVVVIDTLPPESFETRHLPGAINIHGKADDFKDQVQEAVPDESTPVIVYCADEDCQISPTAARTLTEMGYTNVFDFEDGLKGWKDAGFDFERPEGGRTESIQAET